MKSPPEVTLAPIAEALLRTAFDDEGKSGRPTTSLSASMNIESVDRFVTGNRLNSALNTADQSAI
jgi:hypothetical protein